MTAEFDPRGLEVSLFDSGKAPTPSATITLEEWWDVITGDELREATAEARKLAAAEVELAAHVMLLEDEQRGDDLLDTARGLLTKARTRRSRQKNSSFVSVTCGGTFERRLKPDVLARRQALPPEHRDHLGGDVSGHLTWTGLVPLDFDHLLVPGEVDDLIDDLVDDPAIVFVYRSPSGFGVKAFVAVDPVPRDYAEHVYAAEAMFAAYEQAASDAKGGKDAHRLSYGAHDPDAFIADWCRPRRWRRPRPEPKSEPSPAPARAAQPDLRPYVRAALDNALDDISGSGVGQRHDAAVRAAMSLVGFVKIGELDEAAARREWRAAFDAVKPDQLPTEADDIWQHAQTNAEPADMPSSARREAKQAATSEAQRRAARRARVPAGRVSFAQAGSAAARAQEPPLAQPEAQGAPQGDQAVSEPAQTPDGDDDPDRGIPGVPRWLRENRERYAVALELARQHPAWCEVCYYRGVNGGLGRCDAHRREEVLA